MPLKIQSPWSVFMHGIWNLKPKSLRGILLEGHCQVNFIELLDRIILGWTVNCLPSGGCFICSKEKSNKKKSFPSQTQKLQKYPSKKKKWKYISSYLSILSHPKLHWRDHLLAVKSCSHWTGSLMICVSHRSSHDRRLKIQSLEKALEEWAGK